MCIENNCCSCYRNAAISSKSQKDYGVKGYVAPEVITI